MVGQVVLQPFHYNSVVLLHCIMRGMLTINAANARWLSDYTGTLVTDKGNACLRRVTPIDHTYEVISKPYDPYRRYQFHNRRIHYSWS